MSSLSISDLTAAVAGRACAFRSRTKLQPVDGPGGKVFPPTHLNGEYAVEQRVLPEFDQPVECVLLDSVQSYANRCEAALQHAIDRGQLQMPLVVVDFSEADLIDPIGRLTSLEVPHRLADAILRDSELDGKRFRDTELGNRLDFASLKNATPLLDLSPHSLLLGLWDSTGPKGGLGAKFQRCLVGEIIGCKMVRGKKTASRIDPLQIRSSAKVVESKGDWDVAGEKAKNAIEPSKINHGNIPPTISDGGVTFEYALHSVSISLPAIRRLRFPVDGNCTDAADDAGRTLLAAMGLLAVALAAESGFDLRSRCLLWPTEPIEFELLDAPGTQPKRFTLTSDQALGLFNQAVEAVKKAGLPWRTEPVVLRPAAKLVKLLRASQQAATQEHGGEEA